MKKGRRINKWRKAKDAIASPQAEECVASGPGLTGSFLAQQVPTSFTIIAASRGGARLTKGGADFKVAVRGQGRAEPTIRDKGDGTYLVELVYPMSGKYEVPIPLPLQEGCHCQRGLVIRRQLRRGARRTAGQKGNGGGQESKERAEERERGRGARRRVGGYRW